MCVNRGGGRRGKQLGQMAGHGSDLTVFDSPLSFCLPLLLSSSHFATIHTCMHLLSGLPSWIPRASLSFLPSFLPFPPRCISLTFLPALSTTHMLPIMSTQQRFLAAMFLAGRGSACSSCSTTRPFLTSRQTSVNQSTNQILVRVSITTGRIVSGFVTLPTARAQRHEEEVEAQTQGRAGRVRSKDRRKYRGSKVR